MSTPTLPQAQAPTNKSKRKRDHGNWPQSPSSTAFSPFSSIGDNDRASKTRMDRWPGIQERMMANVSYAADASIILVGMTGAGKKTLAVMGAFATGRRYVNFHSFFEKHARLSPSAYLDLHGIEQFRREDLEVTRKLLVECERNCVIGGLSENEGHAHRALLEGVQRTMPVIYIRRAVHELRQSIGSDKEKFYQWYQNRDAFYSSCSSFDFYNVSVDLNDNENGHEVSTLRLKGLERDFVQFLRRILQQPLQILHSAPPLSNQYTYALNVRMSWLELQSEYEELECGADVINLVVDLPADAPRLHDRVAKQVAVLRRHSRMPIVLEPRYSENAQTGYWSMLNLGMKCLCDVLAIDLRADISSSASILQSKARFTIIACLEHDIPWREFFAHSYWPKYRALADDLRCDALRLSCNLKSYAENIECVALAREAAQTCSFPIIAYNVGVPGRTSVCFNPTLSPVIPSSLSSTGLTVKQAQTALYSSFILNPKKFSIFGKSVSYSLSPAMHNAAYEELGLPHKYNYVQSDNFTDIQHLFQDNRCAGVAVTLPYKSTVLNLLNHISDEAKAIGAVNTVLIERSSETATSSSSTILKGYNTDHIGIRESIHRNMSPANSIRSRSSALIVGAGGMARAALYACHTLGLKHICIYNRTSAHAEQLTQQFASSSLELLVLNDIQDPWPPHLQPPTIIISAIPAHTIDHSPAHELDIPLHWLDSRTGGVFIELAYEPVETRFIQQMRGMSSRGWVVVDGLDVLVEQGIAQFELFTGRPAPVHVMRRAVRRG